MDLGLSYIKGLFQSRKRNIERLTEQTTDIDYNRMHHFISESPWDHRAGFDRLAGDTSNLFNGIECDFVGLLIDESAHVKKGEHSVGVSRQWCGTLGKVDNCQVAVYAGLSAEKYYGFVDTELYLPKDWTGNKKRCKRAGVPKERRVYRSKIDLALDIVKRQVNLGTKFEFVGADRLYGNSNHFRQTLDDMELLYVLDVYIDQYVYDEPPNIYLPEKQGDRGRNPTLYKSNSKAVEIRELCPEKNSKKWRQIRLRQTRKGNLVCKGYLQTVYTWDGESEDYRRQVMIIRAMPAPSGEIEYKYALSNGWEDEFEVEEFVRMQSQRYFIERAFQAKQEAGMSEYQDQVRGWRAWHHHMVMVMMALHFILNEKVSFSNEYPLLSEYDVRDILIRVYSKRNILQMKSLFN